MTGIELKDSSEGIYDDGEWISWEYINQQIYVQERQAEFPAANPEVLALFDDDLLDVAIRYKQITGRYLPPQTKSGWRGDLQPLDGY